MEADQSAEAKLAASMPLNLGMGLRDAVIRCPSLFGELGSLHAHDFQGALDLGQFDSPMGLLFDKGQETSHGDLFNLGHRGGKHSSCKGGARRVEPRRVRAGDPKFRSFFPLPHPFFSLWGSLRRILVVCLKPGP